MKNHKINYKKYITLLSVLSMTMVGVATVPNLVNNTKYEVADTNKVVEVEEVTLPEDVKKVEALSDPEPNVKAQAAVAVEKENPFKNKEFLDFFEDLNPESIIETGEATTAKGEEVYYAWSIYSTGITDDGNYAKGTDVDLHIVSKNSFEKMEDFFKYLDSGSHFTSTDTGLAADDKITLAYPEERLNNFELPTDLLDKYYLPATNSTGSIKVNKDHSVTLSRITRSGIDVNLPSSSSSFFSFFEKQDDGEWHEINANSHAFAFVDTKKYKEDVDLEKDLNFKAIIYLNTNALIGESGWEDFPASWKGSPDEIIPSTLTDYNNLKGTVIDVTDDIEITDINNKQPQFTFGETVTLSVKNTLGHNFKDLGKSYDADGNVTYGGLAGFGNLFVEVGYLGPKPETPEPGVSTPELTAESLKFPLENRDFKGLEELIYAAYDSKDGNLTSKVTIKSGNVDLSKVGKYTLVLEVTNSDGNTAEEQVVVEIFEAEKEPNVPATPLEPAEPIEKPEKKPNVPLTPLEPSKPEEVTPEEPVIPDVDVPETPEKEEEETIKEPEIVEEKPVVEEPKVEKEKEESKVVEKVEVPSDPKTEEVKEQETTKEQPKKETLEVEKEEQKVEKETPNVETKDAPATLLQTDITSLNTAAKGFIGLFTAANGLYMFKIRKK